MPILWTRNLHLIVSGHPLELALMGRQHLHTGEPPRVCQWVHCKNGA